MKYVAFLRGINMIGHKPIKMIAIQKAFEELGYYNSKTVGASGNVVFETEDNNRQALMKKIEEKLEKSTGHKIIAFMVNGNMCVSINNRPDHIMMVRIDSKNQDEVLKREGAKIAVMRGKKCLDGYF